MFLAVDSSLGTAVAVVNSEGVVVSEVASDDSRGHAENIGILIQQALHDAHCQPTDITHVVMGVGPGPFTGLRVGMAAAEAFAVVRNTPLIPVVSHDAIAHKMGDVVVVTNARRGEIAYSVYRGLDVKRRVVGPQLCTPAELDEALGEFSGLPRIEARSVSAGSLGLVGRDYVEAGVQLDSAAPQYLRAPDVTVAP